MLKILDYLEKDIEYQIEYVKSINVLNISTELMNDDCIPYNATPASIIWLDDNMMIGEMEYICPIISESGILVKEDTDEVFGVPQLKIEFEEKSVELFLSEKSLFVILDREKIVEKKCISSNIVFYINGDEIVAYECKDFKEVD